MVQDPVVKALHAERLLKDELFREAIGNAHTAIITEWEQAETVQAREKAHCRLLALKEILKGLNLIINDGAVEYAKRGGNPAEDEWDLSTGQPTG